MPGFIVEELKAETYEKKEREAILQCIRKSDRILEIGGGIGIISAIMAQNCLWVDCYEPVNETLNAAESIAQFNELNNITFHPFAVSNVTQNAMMSVFDNFQMNSLFRSASEGAAPVAILPISEVLEPYHTVLMVDAEGVESKILSGLRGRDAEGLRHMIFEVHDHIIGLEGIRQLFVQAASLGFAYDPRLSSEEIVVFTNISGDEKREWKDRK